MTTTIPLSLQVSTSTVPTNSLSGEFHHHSLLTNWFLGDCPHHIYQFIPGWILPPSFPTTNSFSGEFYHHSLPTNSFLSEYCHHTTNSFLSEYCHHTTNSFSGELHHHSLPTNCFLGNCPHYIQQFIPGWILLPSPNNWHHHTTNHCTYQLITSATTINSIQFEHFCFSFIRCPFHNTIFMVALQAARTTGRSTWI